METKTYISREQELGEACELAWDHLRSVYEVANRNGEDTNWEAFRNKTIETISSIAITLGYEPKMPNMAVTAKTFRTPKE